VRRRRRIQVALVAAVVAAGVAGCGDAGTQAPSRQAAELDVATSRISVACGYADELTAFGGRHPAGLGRIESIAQSGARKLASVYDRDHSDIYQGESVGGIVNDSISLLGNCGLPGARTPLRRALDEHP
jgi:hypothetical protein